MSVRVVLNYFYFKPAALIAELVATRKQCVSLIQSIFLFFPSLEDLRETGQGTDTAHEPDLQNSMSRNPT